MQIVVSSGGTNLGAQVSPVFGRCPYLIFVETESLAFEAMENPALASGGGAGVQTAQLVIEKGAQAVVSGNVGPNAFQVFQSAGIPIHTFTAGTVREAVEAFREGLLPTVGGATAPEHAGWGQGMSRRQAAAGPSRDEEIVQLKQAAADLRQRLAEIIERLDRLGKGEEK